MNLLKKLTPSQSVVKQSLRGHSWIGLFWAALLYLICFSGSMVVFYPEMERWEQPLDNEYHAMGVAEIQQALDQSQQKFTDDLESLYYIFPNQAIPRAHVSAVLKDKSKTIESEWWLNQQGDLIEPVSAPWTEMMTGLHIYLHLPNTLGIILVGMLGAMMCGLMISGVLAHPNLFKDAFKLRLGSNYQMEQTDLHNRLSVWGLPFFFVISLTGAYIGLFGVSMTVVDWLEKEHDSEQIIAEVFGDDPVVDQSQTKINLPKIMADLKYREPDAEPIYLVIQQPKMDSQFVEVAASLPNRLIYSEIYRYQSDGTYIDYQHLSDGSAGRQVAYSSYRLHFGHFGGLMTQVLYFFMGMAMAVITVTGVNMWFSKRKILNHWSVLWSAFVWSTPAATALSAFASMVLSVNATWVFWLSLLVCSTASISALRHHDPKAALAQYIQKLKYLTVLTVVLLVFFHGFNHLTQSWYWLFSGSLVVLSVLPLINFKSLLRSLKTKPSNSPLKT